MNKTLKTRGEKINFCHGCFKGSWLHRINMIPCFPVGSFECWVKDLLMHWHICQIWIFLSAKAVSFCSSMHKFNIYSLFVCWLSFFYIWCIYWGSKSSEIWRPFGFFLIMLSSETSQVLKFRVGSIFHLALTFWAYLNF